jgi:hypothetical protein
MTTAMPRLARKSIGFRPDPVGGMAPNGRENSGYDIGDPKSDARPAYTGQNNQAKPNHLDQLGYNPSKISSRNFRKSAYPKRESPIRY